MEAREGLRIHCDANSILTGSVEQYELAMGPDGPVARVAISIRLIDVQTGLVVWSGSREHDGGLHPGPFGLRRPNTAGALATILTRDLIKRLLADLQDT